MNKLILEIHPALTGLLLGAGLELAIYPTAF